MLVPAEGFAPTRLSTTDPKSVPAANYGKRAYMKVINYLESKPGEVVETPSEVYKTTIISRYTNRAHQKFLYLPLTGCITVVRAEVPQAVHGNKLRT